MNSIPDVKSSLASFLIFITWSFFFKKTLFGSSLAGVSSGRSSQVTKFENVITSVIGPVLALPLVSME